MKAAAKEGQGGQGRRATIPPRAFRLAAWLDSLRSDPYRRAALPSDLLGWCCVAVFQLCLLLLKTLLQERQPWLAAVNSTHALLALALAALVRRRPDLYAAAREPLVFLASLHLCFVTMNGALRGSTNVMAQHGGSSLRLLSLLLLAGPPVPLCLYALYTRLSLAWNVVALPLLAAAPALLGGGAMCKRMLDAPGTEAPLSMLHSLLQLFHSVTFELLPRGAQPSPMQQCWHVNAWASLAVGALLPLLVLRGWQRAARKCWDYEKRQETAESEAAKGSAACCSTQAAAEVQQMGSVAGGEYSSPSAAEPSTPRLRPPGWWLLEPWLASALLWSAAGLGAAFLFPAT